MKRNHLLWLSPALGFLGLTSYWGLIYRWPALSDVPWVNFSILALAVGLSLIALRRAWPRGVWLRVAGVAGVVWSTALSAVLVLYCAVWSYNLPDPAGGLAVGAAAPRLALPDQEGRALDLGEAAMGQLVLVFFRGHW